MKSPNFGMANMLNKRKLLNLASMLGIVFTVTAPVLAQRGDSYILSRFTVCCGSVHSTGEQYILYATAGQPATSQISGGSYIATGGFYHQPVSKPGLYRVHLPFIYK
jgi:hypothetical protein